MTIRIITGDCRDVLASLPAESFDCCVADPPYGETSLAWDRWPEGWPALARRVLKPNGSMWVFGSQRMFWERRGEFSGWRLVQDVIWEKHNGSGFQADRFRRVHEVALHFVHECADWAEVYRSPQFTHDATARSVRRLRQPPHTGAIGESSYATEDGGPRLMRSVIYARSEHGRAEHPTQKPIAIVEPLLLYACPPGGHVIDPFAGSGTTALVARRHGMDCTAIEIDPQFAAMAERRIQGDAPLFAEASV